MCRGTLLKSKVRKLLRMGTDKMEEKHRAQLNPGCSINANAPKAELPPNYFNAVGNFPMAADREEQLSFRQKGTAGASREACDTGNQITAGAPPDSGNGPFLFHLQPHPTLQPQVSESQGAQT